MRQSTVMMVGVFAISLLLASLAQAECLPDSVEVGPLCVDQYEASVWEIPVANEKLIKRVKQGKATLHHLTAGGAIQRGIDSADYPCSDNGNDCKDKIFAVSIPGVIPSQFATWFQAQQAYANTRKRLPTNAEWQMAAAGTPDGPPCIVSATGPGPTSTEGCVSTWGAFDMVGNLWEWVADWVPLNTVCPGWGPFSDDSMCLAGARTDTGPGTMVRGGRFDMGNLAGVFSLVGTFPTVVGNGHGFRCVR